MENFLGLLLVGGAIILIYWLRFKIVKIFIYGIVGAVLGSAIGASGIGAFVGALIGLFS